MSAAIDQAVPERIQIHSGEDYVTYLVTPAGLNRVLMKRVWAGLPALAMLFLLYYFVVRDRHDRPIEMIDAFLVVMLWFSWHLSGKCYCAIVNQAQVACASFTIDHESVIVRIKNGYGETSLHWRRKELESIVVGKRTFQNPFHPLSGAFWWREPCIWIKTHAGERISVLAGHFLGDELKWLANALSRELELPTTG